jgi:hypothetical protein
MEWLVQPFTEFLTYEEIEAADNCSGGGTLRHCDCTYGLIVCGPSPNSFIIK